MTDPIIATLRYKLALQGDSVLEHLYLPNTQKYNRVFIVSKKEIPEAFDKFIYTLTDSDNEDEFILTIPGGLYTSEYLNSELGTK